MFCICYCISIDICFSDGAASGLAPICVCVRERVWKKIAPRFWKCPNENRRERDKKEEFSELPQNIRQINTLGVGRGLCRCLTDLLALHPKTCVRNKSSKCYRKLRFTFSVHRTHTHFHFLRASIFFSSSLARLFPLIFCMCQLIGFAASDKDRSSCNYAKYKINRDSHVSRTNTISNENSSRDVEREAKAKRCDEKRKRRKKCLELRA